MTNDAPRMLEVHLRHPGDGPWQVVIETEGQRRQLADIAALIRYLQQLAAPRPQAPRGLR